MLKIPLLKGCDDLDLIRMRSLLESTLKSVEVEIYDRLIPKQVVTHNSKTLTLQYIIEDHEIELNFK
jgi:hypothetical protein